MQGPPLVDGFGRVARKLRISITDRCNFRCTFCMPTTPEWLPREEILSYEEITRVASIFAQMGVEKIRLSGGEPLVRKDVEKLVRLLREDAGLRNISMTTNGFFLAEKARVLKDAGLRSITVSLHSLRPDRFAELTGRDVHARVLRAIEVARDVGLTPVKVNCVIIRGWNDDEVVPLAAMARMRGVVVRFIEFMPFDGKHLWQMEKVFSRREILERVAALYPLVPLPRDEGSTAGVYRFADGSGEIGIISSITEPFCGDCDRVRLTADGKVVPCLWDRAEFDLKPLLRGGATDEEIAGFLRRVFYQKAPGVETLIKELMPLQHVRPMHTIGG